jgi:protoporphyrinogen oxidase
LQNVYRKLDNEIRAAPKMGPKSIAVVGGGVTGIAAAIELAKTGRFEVFLYEKRGHLGGLSDYYQWNDVTWDRFYHVILSTDRVLLDFLHELNLDRKIIWRETKTGFYGKGRLVSLSSSLDFVRFPFMGIFQKLRLALGILYSASIKGRNETRPDLCQTMADPCFRPSRL